MLVIILGGAGGMVRVLDKKGKKEISPAKIIGQIFISAFVGVIFYLVLSAFDIPGTIVAAICGVAGFLGTQGFGALFTIFRAQGVDLEAKDKKK